MKLLDWLFASEYEVPTFRRATEQMTNHERSRWAQAGYPGLVYKEVDCVNAFVEALRRA